jgi:membrane AbrB-like protein
LAARFKVPAGAILLTMIAVAVASGSGKFAVVLPCWLVAGAYAGVGWYVGLAFTREVVRYALRSLPILAGSTLLLIVLCAAVGESLRGLIHADPLTAYLATSPGGLDSVAIIALGSGANVPLVLAIQLEGKSPASPSSSMPGCGTLRSPPNARSELPVHPLMGEVVGIDLGVNRWAALSDGSFIDGENAFKKHQERLAALQQQLARCVKFSKNWVKIKRRSPDCTRKSPTSARIRYTRLPVRSAKTTRSQLKKICASSI